MSRPSADIREEGDAMRTLKIIEHASLDGVIQNSNEDGDFPSQGAQQSFRGPAQRGPEVTHRPESLAWGPFEGVGPDLVEGVRRSKSQGGPNPILSGSCTLTSALLEHGLRMNSCWSSIPPCWGPGSASLRREPRRAPSSSSAGRRWRLAYWSSVTRQPGHRRPAEPRR